MAVNYIEIAEGQVVSASVANASLEAVRTEVNDLDETSIEKNTLHREHLPSTVLSAHTTGISGTDHTYTASAYPYPGWNTVSGWATTGLDTQVQSLFLSREKTAGILVLANINVKDISGIWGISAASSTTAYHPSWMAVFAIQFRAGGAWRHVARTERYVEMDTGDDNDFLNSTPKTAVKYATDLLGKDVAIRTLIKESDNPSGMSVDAVRLVVAVKIPYLASPSSIRETTVTLRQGNISAIALQAGEIS